MQMENMINPLFINQKYDMTFYECDNVKTIFLVLKLSDLPFYSIAFSLKLVIHKSFSKKLFQRNVYNKEGFKFFIFAEICELVEEWIIWL